MTKEQRLRETHKSLVILVSDRSLLAGKSQAIDFPYCNAAKQRNVKRRQKDTGQQLARKSISLKSVLCISYGGMIPARQQALIWSCPQGSRSYNALRSSRSSIGCVQLHSPVESPARGRAGSILPTT